MAKLDGQWTTEYAVRFVDHEGESVHIDHEDKKDDAELNLAWYRDAQEYADAHIVTRQKLVTEWLPHDSKEQTS